MIQNIEAGGLKLCHFDTKIAALKLSWIGRLTSKSNQKWKILPRLFYNCQNLQIYFNANHIMLKSIVIPEFYIDLHILYMDNFKQEPLNILDILDQSLWLNQHIQINSKCIYLKQWEKLGIYNISNLIDNFGNLLSHEQLKSKYNLNTNFLTTLQLHKSIPKGWLKALKNTTETIKTKNSDIRININNKYKLLQTTKCKGFYWFLINKNKHIPSCKKSWKNIFSDLTVNNESKWHHIFKTPFISCRETKLHSFQFIITHRIISCNEWLHKLKIKQSNKCNFCPHVTDSLQHFFITCPYTYNFWVHFKLWWHTNLNTKTFYMYICK